MSYAETYHVVSHNHHLPTQLHYPAFTPIRLVTWAAQREDKEPFNILLCNPNMD